VIANNLQYHQDSFRSQPVCETRSKTPCGAFSESLQRQVDPIPPAYEKCSELPACRLPLMRIPHRRFEARLAHAASLAAVALRKSVSTGRAPELDSSRRVTLRVGLERGSFRSAPNAFLAEEFVALHAHTGHDCPQMSRKNWVGLAIAAKTANGNGGVNARGRTTDRISVAIAAS